MVNIAILSSGSGNSSKKLLKNIKNMKNNINLIITNKSDAKIIDLAKEHKISYIYLPKKKDVSNIMYDRQLSIILKSYNIHMIFLIGYMRIIIFKLINNYKNNIFNIHPSLLPKYKGMMDLDIHQAVIENNDSYTVPCETEPNLPDIDHSMTSSTLTISKFLSLPKFEIEKGKS